MKRKEKLAEDIALATKHLFAWVPMDRVLQDKGGVIYHLGRPLSEDETAKLAEEARHILGSTMWQALKEGIKCNAHLRVFEKAQSVDDLLIGKSALWVLEQIETTLHKVSSLRT